MHLLFSISLDAPTTKSKQWYMEHVICHTRPWRIKKAVLQNVSHLFFYSVTFIPCSSSLFIIHVRAAALYEKELDGIRNWPSVLGTLLPSSWKAMSPQARYPTSNLRVCRLSTASFRTVFFSLRFLNFCPRLCCLCPSRTPIPSSFHPKFSYRRFRRRLEYF